MTVHPPLSDQLRSALMPLHDQLQAVPYFTALINNKAPLSPYVTHLRIWAMVHAAIESGLDRADCAAVSEVWFDGMRRLPLILADIDYFRDVPPVYPLIPDPVQPMERAFKIVGVLRKDGGIRPASLLGCLYVLEGAVAGGKPIALALSRAFGLTARTGAAYYWALKEDGPSRFEAFKMRLDAASLSSRERECIVRAAMDFMAECIDLFTDIYDPSATPEVVERGIRFHALSFNPEAGNHPVCQDPREISAVMAASLQCLVDYPYLVYRFGARGRRFADSDGAWLVYLTTLEPEYMLSQVLWSGRLLASRGLPQLLVENHLRLLHRELCRLIPENQDRYDTLLFCADHIRRTRQELLSEDVVEALKSDFCSQTGLYGNFAAEEAAKLIIAAVIDEAQGLPNATDSLLPWLADPMRRPASWIKTVRIIMDRAHRAIAAKKARHEHIA